MHIFDYLQHVIWELIIVTDELEENTLKSYIKHKREELSSSRLCGFHVINSWSHAMLMMMKTVDILWRGNFPA